MSADLLRAHQTLSGWYGLFQRHVGGPEAIADTGADHDRVDINVRRNRDSAPDICVSVGFKPKLLEIEVQEPIAAKLVVETGLHRGAPSVVKLEARIVRPRALIKEDRVIHAAADVRLKGRPRVEVILQCERRRQKPRVPNLAESRNSARAVDRVGRDA